MKADAGKIGNEEFEHIILKKTGSNRQEVQCGPAFGIDVSVINMPDGNSMALTSDPLSLIPSLGMQESAWLSVHLMANDMATTGFAPMYAQLVLNLPTWLSPHDFSQYWNFIHGYCQSIGVSITGGHTGRIDGQNSTIAGGGTMLLTAPTSKIKLSRYAKTGDAIIVTKECAISSAAILAMSFPKTVSNKLGQEVYQNTIEKFYQTSSLKEALHAAAFDPDALSAMHDVTEGGVLGAIYEMAIASGLGVQINNDALPRGIENTAVCELFGLDSRFCIGAGSMIMAVNSGKAEQFINHLTANQIPASIVGHFSPQSDGYQLIENGIVGKLPYHATDLYWNAFFNAMQKGWK